MALDEETRERLRFAEANMRDIREEIPRMAEKLTAGEITTGDFIGTVAGDLAVVADALAEVIAALEYV